MTKMIKIAQPIIGNEELRRIKSVLEDGQLTQGKLVEEFEKEFAKYIGSKYAVAVNNGTAALYLSLMAHGIGVGDEVITSSFSFIASANAILYTGAKPIFADIDEIFNIDPRDIIKKISPKTRAILPIHLFGMPADMDEIKKIAQKYKLLIIEDACQAHGASVNGIKVGASNTSAFSFYATKNMTTGEGGMVTTNSKSIADKIRLLRNHGSIKRYYHDILGYNFRMTDIAAAIGLVQLKKLKKFNNLRKMNAEYLLNNLELPGIILPKLIKNRKSVFHQFTIRVTPKFPLTRDELAAKLEQVGIGTGIFYPLPIHKQKLYKNLGYKDRLSRAETFSKEVLSLPIHPGIKQSDLDFIIDSINSIYQKAISP